MSNEAIMNTIVYDSEEEYKSMCNEFRKEFQGLIAEYHIDYWKYYDYMDNNSEHFGLPFSCNLYEILHKTLMKLTKNQNEKWVDNISNILYLGIRGLAQSVSYMNNNCGEPDVCVETQNSFRQRELCNTMIIHMVNTILFDLVDEKGETLDGCENSGHLTKIVHITCDICNKLYNISHGFENTCYDCHVKTDTTR
jgi:hypothetical protein